MRRTEGGWEGRRMPERVGGGLRKKWMKFERDGGGVRITEEASEGRRRSERDGGGLRKNG